MNKLKLYILVLSILLETIEIKTTVHGKETESTPSIEMENSLDRLDQVVFKSSSLSYEEIDKLLDDKTWKEQNKYEHSEKEILWNEVYEQIKENNKKYLSEHQELTFLTEFSDEELKEILKRQKAFIEQIEKEYTIDLGNIACNFEDKEILKDTRNCEIMIPYYATYEPSTKTMIFLEDEDKQYGKITEAHEETHFLQSGCKHTSENTIKYSVWEEPIEFSERNIPSPLRTICLDEYIAYIQSQKTNPKYPIDIPSFDLLLLLELAFLPNENYQYQDTLTSLSLTQDQAGFYQLFQASTEENKKNVHYIMHTIDLCYGYFREETIEKNISSEELIINSLLEINRIFCKNLIKKNAPYNLNDLFYIINLEKEFSLYILDNYLLENNVEDRIPYQEQFLKEYQVLESILFQELSTLYQENDLKEKYQQYDPFKNIDNKQNEKLLNLIEIYIAEYKEYQKQKSLSEIPLY